MTRPTTTMKAAGWAIWCDDEKKFHRLDGAVRLFSDRMFAKDYLEQKVPSRVACDRVVEVEICIINERKKI